MRVTWSHAITFVPYTKSQMLKTTDVAITVMLHFHSKEFNIEVLKKFIALHTFQDKSIVDALR